MSDSFTQPLCSVCGTYHPPGTCREGEPTARRGRPRTLQGELSALKVWCTAADLAHLAKIRAAHPDLKSNAAAIRWALEACARRLKPRNVKEEA